MATKRPTRRRKELVIEPLNWVAPDAPDAREDQSDKRVEKDEVEQDDKKMAKS